MQWKKLTRLKAATGNSRTRRMLCCGRRKENGRSVPDVTASPGRAPPGPLPNQIQNMGQRQGQVAGQQHHQQQQQNFKEPVLLQGDFRKVSGISSEIFRQIEAVENDHDPNTAAALEAVERRGEMIVRILEARNIGGKQAVEAAQKLITKGDARHTVQLVEIVKRPGQTLGLYIREGNGADRTDGVFISRIALESAVYNSGCLRVGDEILAVNLVDVTHMSLDDVVIIMSIPRRLVLAIRQRRGSSSAGNRSYSPGGLYTRQEQKPPPVVVIKRDLRDEDLDESDRMPRSRSSRERRTGDGREMTESRSRLGLGLNNYSPQSEQLDLFYNSRPPNVINEPPTWGYKPPPPPSVITEQPKSHHAFQPSPSYFQNAGTLESLAEKVHSFYPGGPSRRMSAGTGQSSGMVMSQSHSRFPRSGSDQHLPRVEYGDPSYASLGRHSLLRSTLKTGAPIASGGTLGRYGRYDPPRTSKYGTPNLGGPSSLSRRSRPNLDYSSDTEATIGPSRPSYYYYNRPAMSTMTRPGAGHGPTSLLGGPDLGKFNSLPRDRPGVRLPFDRFLDDADGNLSAPESSARRERNLLRNRITASPSIFTSDEYRAWLRRAPSSSAICDQMRMSRDLLIPPRSHRFSCSAENIHDALKNTENIYSGRTGVITSTLDRNLAGIGGARGIASLPVRSMSSQHIGGAASLRSPSIRRMRQLLELSTGQGPSSPSGSIMSTGHQSPAPTPSATLPRAHRQIDINPAEFVKYKLDKPVVDVGGISGMLWIHLLAGRGLRTQPDIPPNNPAAVLQQQQQQQQQSRDLYCVLECDRVHKARTVVRSGDLQFDWDESFELDLVCNKQLDVLVYSWDPQHRHKLCYRGAISLASLLRQSPLHQLALKVEPRGTIYIRLRHTDPITLYKRRGLPSLRAGYPQLFGADLETVVNRESKGTPGSAPVPIVLRRCVEEVERRGLDIIGLYRLCGSATKKRLLREAFERNSRAVELSPEHVPDINVITGVLKDYLRELPEPLFTRCLFQMTIDALAVCLPDDPEGNAKLMLSILDCLPRANRATLVFLLDHLSLVVCASERNKMSAQALATVMGPPLMLHSSSATPGSDIDHAQPIAVLKYLLQIWPQPQNASGVTGTASGRRGEPTGQRGNKVNVLQVGKPHQSLVNLHMAAASVGTVGRSQGQLHPSVIANTRQYQSVVDQLAQSLQVSQQVAQQRLQSAVSADLAMHAQLPLPGTPSPGSSSTSTGSGSSDTVKRGASPISVKQLKIHDTPPSTTSSNKQTTNEMQQSYLTKVSSASSNIMSKTVESNNDNSRNNYGSNQTSSYIDQKYSSTSAIKPFSSSSQSFTSSSQPFISSSQPFTSSMRYRHPTGDDSDSDSASTRSKTPNPLIEQSQALTTTQLMSKYLKREPVVSMTLIESPSPPIISSLSSSIRDLTIASQSAAIGGIHPIDSPNRFEQKFSTSFSKQLSAASVSTPSSTTSEPSNSFISNTSNKLSNSQTLGLSQKKFAFDTDIKANTLKSLHGVNGSSSSSSSARSLPQNSSSVINKKSSPSRHISNNTTNSVGRNLTLSTTTSNSGGTSTNNLNIIDDKEININNYPISPDPFNTSHIKFDTNGSTTSLTNRTGNGNGNNFYNIYGTLPKTQQLMISSTSSYLSGGSGGSGGDTTTTSGISSMTGSTNSSYDFYSTTHRQYGTIGGTSTNGSNSSGLSGNSNGGNYHTLGSYRVQYTATNPFLDIFEPPNGGNTNNYRNGNNGSGNGSKSSSLNLNSLKDKYDEYNDLK